jgi:hypothetical protein
MELQIRGVSKTYANGVRALKDVTLTIPAGMYGLLGRTRSRARVVGHASRARRCRGSGAPGRHPRNVLRDAGGRGDARPRASTPIRAVHAV